MFPFKNYANFGFQILKFLAGPEASVVDNLVLMIKSNMKMLNIGKSFNSIFDNNYFCSIETNKYKFWVPFVKRLERLV